MFLHERLGRYIQRLVAATRPYNPDTDWRQHSPSDLVERGVDLGASPRAIICWSRLAKVWALLQRRRAEVFPEDIQDLAPFVDRLEQGDDLVIGSRFNGTIHGDAMPFLNRFVGNPVLTGMLNVLFGVKVSDAHCGMRAVRRAALPVLDLHSTGLEFASEMVYKAYRRGLVVTEVPIDYYPRVGESKLNRFGDAWRHVRFMLLYSPSWLYLVPGTILLLLGLAGMVALGAGAALASVGVVLLATGGEGAEVSVAIGPGSIGVRGAL